MRFANYVEETTTSIAGTNGDGAITLTAVTGRPRFSTVFGAGPVTVRYAIEAPASNMLETGVGVVSSNVLTRTRPQTTWSGSTWVDQSPSALQFGSSPSSGDVRIRMAALAQDVYPVIPGVQSTLSGDANWRDYPISGNRVCHTTATAGSALTANLEYYGMYLLNRAGVLTGAQLQVGTASAGNLKWALYEMDSTGLPAAKIVDFTTITTMGSTGYKTDTAFTPVTLTPGWYAIGYIVDSTPTLNGVQDYAGRHATPLGRAGTYGYGHTCYVAGSYSAGLPAVANLSGGALLSAHVNEPWLGLRVVP